MKTLRLITIVLAVAQLTSCSSIVESLWLTTYRIKGGYYNKPDQLKGAKPTQP